MAFGVKANVKAPHRFLRMGALCWLTLTNPGWGNERVEVWGMSRNGRKVATWIDARDLTNFRAGWIKDDPTQYIFPFDTRQEAQDLSDSMNQRFGEQQIRPHALAFSATRKQPGAV